MTPDKKSAEAILLSKANRPSKGSLLFTTCIEVAQEYARQFQSDNSNLEKLLELKEEERKEWARMCILKQDKIYFLQLDKNTEIGNLKMIHDLDQLQNKKQLEIIEGLAKELIKLKSEETNNITKP
jgi:hypothetical protein